MDNLKCVVFVALMAIAVEIVIEKGDICVS